MSNNDYLGNGLSKFELVYKIGLDGEKITEIKEFIDKKSARLYLQNKSNRIFIISIKNLFFDIIRIIRDDQYVYFYINGKLNEEISGENTYLNFKKIIEETQKYPNAEVDCNKEGYNIRKEDL